MKAEKTLLNGVIIIKEDEIEDQRGWFKESYSKKKFFESGILVDFVQDNHSMSKTSSVLRGLHFQNNPKSQVKLVRCTKGKILDVAVDLRRGSSTYKKWISVELSEDNHKQLFIPKGFAHGFLVLSNGAEVQYKVDEYYSPECDRSIRFNDPEIGIEWGIETPLLSNKDFNAPFLKDSDCNYSIKVLVTGARGQLGSDIVRVFFQNGIDVKGVDVDDFDITNQNEVKTCIMNYFPDVVIHCAAFTDVDKAESEKEKCFAVNFIGTKNVAEAVRDINAQLVYVSTDYVYGGEGNDPFPEEKKPNPINYYGYTKALGEEIIRQCLDSYYIVRTSWLYGINGNNFVKTILKLSETKESVSVVDDQIGAPTYTIDLANYIFNLIQTNEFGVYHGVNDGFCSWYEFATAIYDNTNTITKLIPICSSEYPTIAIRPLNSRLSTKNTTKIRINRIPHWEDALSRFIKELNIKDKKK